MRNNLFLQIHPRKKKSKPSNLTEENKIQLREIYLHWANLFACKDDFLEAWGFCAKETKGRFLRLDLTGRDTRKTIGFINYNGKNDKLFWYPIVKHARYLKLTGKSQHSLYNVPSTSIFVIPENGEKRYVCKWVVNDKMEKTASDDIKVVDSVGYYMGKGSELPVCFYWLDDYIPSLQFLLLDYLHSLMNAANVNIATIINQLPRMYLTSPLREVANLWFYNQYLIVFMKELLLDPLIQVISRYLLYFGPHTMVG